MVIVQEYQPMTDDPAYAKLDLLVHSSMEARGKTGRVRGVIIRTQWLTCAICFVAAAVIFKPMPA